MDLQSDYGFNLGRNVNGNVKYYMAVYALYPHGQYVVWGGPPS
jgi:hypothetical protein